MPVCPTKKEIGNFLVNNGPATAFILILLIVNIVLFVERYGYYTWGGGAQYSEVIGTGVAIARGTAAAIRLDCAIILLTVLRNFLSWLRGTFIGSYFPIDKNITFHKLLAWVIAFLGTVHTVSHTVNVYKIAYVAAPADLVRIGILQDGALAPTPWQWLFTTIPGITGVIATFAMILMYTTAVSTARRPMFELFWFTHHLFIFFYIALCVHGVAGILEPPMFWYWTIGPMVFYLIERIIRVVRGSKKTLIIQAIQHQSRVIEIRMKKAKFDYKAGQYVFLCCPYIADYEWHPFTISSAPNVDYLSVHIRVVGDWTGALYELLNPERKLGLIQENMITAPNGKPIFYIDGPFGTASEDVFKFQNVILWAAGIGVTPFAAILKAINHSIESNDTSCQIKKVEFYWVNRDHQCFEWFIDLLAQLEQKCPFLEIHLYFTGDLNAEQVRAVMYGDVNEDADAFTGLSARTNFGRPDIDQIFSQKAQDFAGQTVGVFFCGPQALAKSLYSGCARHTSVQTGTKFIFHKENF